MRYSKLNPILRASISNLQDSATPSSINYAYNFGSLLGILMTFMVISGVLLAIHYVGTSMNAFSSVEHIMTDVRLGYFIRYLHANTASLIFFTMYCHIIRNVYYGSYRQPRSGTYLVGQVIVLLIIGTAFLGYSLVYGQMSLWGATVISNLATAVPYIGTDVAVLLWGAYSVSSPTVTKFYSLHYILALVVLALAVVHLLILHLHASSSPIGTSGNYDRTSMAPIFLVKDAITILLILIALFSLIAYAPTLLGHSDNFIEANSLITPSSIQPEWFLLTYYAILRSVPNKLIGVVLMVLAIIWLSALILDVSIIRSNTFKPLNRILLSIGLFTFLALLSLGAKHIEVPYIMLGQSLTVAYFSVLLVMVPSSGLIENDLASNYETASESDVHTQQYKLKFYSGSAISFSYPFKPTAVLFTSDLYIKKKRLTPQERSLYIIPNQLQDVMVGSLLGDSSVFRTNPKNLTTNCYYTITQSGNIPYHVQYIEHMLSLFKPYMSKDYIMKPMPVRNLTGAIVSSSLTVRTLSFPCFIPYRELYYNEITGVKHVPVNIGELLTPRGLAYWIMDDGAKHGEGLILCTHAFLTHEVELLLDTIRNLFGTRSLVCSIIYNRDDKGIIQAKGHRIDIWKESMLLIRRELAKYMVSSMLYKIGLDNKSIEIRNNKIVKLAFRHLDLVNKPSYYGIFFNNNMVRTMPIDVVSVLTSQYLAYLIMDIGTRSSAGLSLVLRATTQSEALRLKLAIDNLYGPNTLNVYCSKGSNDRGYRLYFNKASVQFLLPHILPYMDNRMLYKLGLPNKI